MTAIHINGAKLRPGNVIYYVLRDEQRPTNPFYQWPGKIIRVTIGKPGILNVVWIESLEPGYEGCCEHVLLDQITRIEPAIRQIQLPNGYLLTELDPNNAFAYSNRGTALYNLKRYEEALTAYEQAIRLDPNNAFAYYSKGLSLQALGRSKEAKQAFEKAHQLGYNG